MAKWLFDPGHGGRDSGAVYNGRYEKNDVLNLCNKVGSLLKENGEEVYFTRTTDVDLTLNERSRKENISKFDYFISFHRNAYKPEEARGVETYIFSKGSKMEKFAGTVNKALINIGFADRGVKTANFHVLKQTRCPAMLIEVGFIDNTHDNNLFDNNFSKIAHALAEAFLNQIGKTIFTPAEKPLVGAGNEFYRVVCGSFTNKDNAEKRKNELQKLGYKDVFVDIYKK